MGRLKALVVRDARTQPGAGDPDLAGRTYAIPFAAVWDATLRLATGKLRGWTLVREDDMEGVVEVMATSWPLRLPARIVVSVTLDANAQTRVDLLAEGRHKGGDLGANARRIKRFIRALDRLLDVRADQVLTAPGEPRPSSVPAKPPPSPVPAEPPPSPATVGTG